MPAWSLAAPDWVYRFRRLRRPERMDQADLPAAERRAALDGLERVAAWPGQRGPILEALLGLLGPPHGRRWRLVEVGAGNGNLARWLGAQLGARGHRVELLATDLTPAPGVRHLDAVRGRLPEADVYYSNLMLHHLPDAAVTTMLERQARACGRGLLHFDLQRHWAHFYGALALFAATGMPPIIRHDGMRSIQQGFSRAELRALARPLGGVRVDWTAPFRWRLSWRRP